MEPHTYSSYHDYVTSVWVKEFKYPQLLGLYKLVNFKKIPHTVYDACMRQIIKIIPDNISLNKRLSSHNLKLYSGKALLSALFPDDFNYSVAALKIVDGIVVEGEIVVELMSSNRPGSILTTLLSYYGNDVTIEFMDNLLNMINVFISSTFYKNSYN